MIHDQERLRGIQSNAQLAVDQLRTASGLETFGFNTPSVQWVEGYIEATAGELHSSPKPDFVKSLSSVLGLFPRGVHHPHLRWSLVGRRAIRSVRRFQSRERGVPIGEGSEAIRQRRWWR